jgi:hypothetical protein
MGRTATHSNEGARVPFETAWPILSSWEDLVRREPRLRDLERDVRGADDGTGARWCGLEAWHGSPGEEGLKGRLARLVGWCAEDPDLSDGYDVAFRRLFFDCLPPCRGCSCVDELDGDSGGN